MSLAWLGFASPWLLLALAALPVLWWLLRAIPPAPLKRRFAGISLLLGLADKEHETDKTPWWLLLLRCVALAAAIVGFAGPVLNPQNGAPTTTAPRLILLDGSWGDAGSWTLRLKRAEDLLNEAGRQGRQTALQLLSAPTPSAPRFQTADAILPVLRSLQPSPWAPPALPKGWGDGLPAALETIWLSDGINHPARTALAQQLAERGPLRVIEGGPAVTALRPPKLRDGQVVVTAARLTPGTDRQVQVQAIGPDPAGIERVLIEAPVVFDPTSLTAETEFEMPAELRNRVRRFEIQGENSVAAVSLADDGLRRRKVALLGPGQDTEGLQLLSPTHYLTKALAPTTTLITGALPDMLRAAPDVVVLADIAQLAPTSAQALTNWVQDGGLLVRFAGPRLANSDVARGADDPLMPVRLRAGGRTVGGAMSWGQPKRLTPFPADGPFAGLSIPDEVTVRAQVLAQPDPDLAQRTIAQLADGTPLVTRKTLGNGQIVLFHVTANAEWSSLPVSGLFVQMLDRLALSSGGTGPQNLETLVGTVWAAETHLDAFGDLSPAPDLPGLPGEALFSGPASAAFPPGLYADGTRQRAHNVITDDTVLAPAVWPAGVVTEPLSGPRPVDLRGIFLTLATALVMLDVLATLALSGRLRSTAAALVALIALGQPTASRAQDEFALTATDHVVLAHILTGDRTVDATARDGLRGLSQVLTRRTSIEPADPIGIDLETTDLSLFPFLYWPVTTTQPLPSDEAYGRLNSYLRSGGMILFDTRDADQPGQSATSKRLQNLAAPLDIPPLEPVPADHVLTRAFYLLQTFPGRYNGAPVWIEAAPNVPQRVEGMPFRNLNDGVSPVMIGGNDWAAAWAIDQRGIYQFRVGRGYAGERQREMAYRFGVNLIMHVLTGNYKSDQVHVPALLERLGQ